MENLETLLETIELLMEQQDTTGLFNLLEELNISEVKDLIDELPEFGATFIELLPISRSVHVFRILDFPVQERIIKKMSGAKISELINELPPGDRTAYVSELDGDAVKKRHLLLPAEDRKEALGLLGYKEDSVGRLMTPDYIAVKRYGTVALVMEHIR